MEEWPEFGRKRDSIRTPPGHHGPSSSLSNMSSLKWYPNTVSQFLGGLGPLGGRFGIFCSFSVVGGRRPWRDGWLLKEEFGGRGFAQGWEGVYGQGRGLNVWRGTDCPPGLSSSHANPPCMLVIGVGARLRRQTSGTN